MHTGKKKTEHENLIKCVQSSSTPQKSREKLISQPTSNIIDIPEQKFEDIKNISRCSKNLEI